MRVLKLGSTGSDVMKMQAVLKKTGYGPAIVDGVFGNETKQAVIKFQRNNSLASDGVVGGQTFKILDRFYLGYDIYTIRNGDSVYNIAKAYYTTVNRIITANPGLNFNNLLIGQKIIVPYGIDVVDTNVNYTYEIMQRDIEGLVKRYPFIETGIAGKSVLGKNLYYIKLGSGPNQVFYNGSHHALEWITSPLLMKFIENYSKSYTDAANIKGYNIQDIFRSSTIYIIPMVNPDGVDLVIDGLQKDNPYYSRLIEWNKGSADFSKVWEANIRGVDLNHNYDASWNLSKQAEAIYGITGPGPTRYSGTAPESEPESKAIANFTRNHNFRLVIAYHSQGEVIYWTYLNKIPPGSKATALLFSKASGYTLAEATGIVSYAGYKDWFIDKFNRPGFTIEVGKGENPIGLYQFDKIYNDNIEILLLASIV